MSYISRGHDAGGETIANAINCVPSWWEEAEAYATNSKDWFSEVSRWTARGSPGSNPKLKGGGVYSIGGVSHYHAWP